MPKRTDIRSILIIGSGPIVIGQGCEFDYSGTQACKALREEDYRVVLLNSNPATIMTDPQTADRTYVEPITPEFVEKILEYERQGGAAVDALLPTLGGQTGLNCAMDCAESGMLERFGVEMIGASAEAIHKAENRTAFKQVMQSIGLDVPCSGTASSWEQAKRVLRDVHLPCCIRPAYTLGGEGGGFCHTQAEFEQVARRGMAASRVGEILIEENLYGWKEFELEVMRDRADNVVIICTIENVDPMGVHTGDSITVAPAQTLSDVEYQQMRDSAISIIRAIGVDTGGCNIQFGVDPETGRQVVIEMNPRVSRSSALASKATGYPIARIAAKLAVGYTLDELPNDITKTTPASFEPTIDYVVVKMPRWNFEKFPDANETLNTQMKSVGEAMAIGRTFKEAFQKCIRSMEIKRYGYGLDGNDKWLHGIRSASEKPQKTQIDPSPERKRAGTSAATHPTPLGGNTATEAPPDTDEQHATSWPIPLGTLRTKLSEPCQGRPYYIRYAFKMGWSVDDVFQLTRIDPWFLAQMQELVRFEDTLTAAEPLMLSGSDPRPRPDDSDDSSTQEHVQSDYSEPRTSVRADTRSNSTPNRDDCTETAEAASKQWGYSEVQRHTARAGSSTGQDCDARRRPVYKLVDTCAGEFEAATPYYYSSHESPSYNVFTKEYSCDDEIRVSNRLKVVVLGGGPNRIGQGIEFDYCCCHASYAARQRGFESVMINSNPETVSTDFDTSDMLFFEPLTHEDVLNVIERLNGAPLQSDKRSDTGQQEPLVRPARSVRSASSAPSVRSLHPGDDRGDGHSGGLVKGVIVQFGGQTPINLAQGLKNAGVPILGTQPEMVHLAEDREEFEKVLRELSLLQPPNGIARDRGQAIAIATDIGYPVLVRPSYVLGGRGMRICNNQSDLDDFLKEAFGATDRTDAAKNNPVLIDKFLSDAIEVDVDAVADYGQGEPPEDLGPGDRHGPRCMVAGIMEHIEEAGIHSGDSTCVLPPFSLGRMVIEELFRSTRRLAERLQVCGAINIQYAILNRTVYVLEVNPRASRTLPFVAKATGVPWARIATRVMLGESLADVLASYGIDETPRPKHTAIKAPVFPFEKFAGVDVVLGPEMRSTGEAMAIDTTFGRALAKAQIATGMSLPTSGNILISVNDADKPRCVSIARDLYDLGFSIFSTVGTRRVLAESGIAATLVSKFADRSDAPFLLSLIESGSLDLLINTPIRTGPASDEGRWRAAAAARRIPLITTLAGARAAVAGIRALTKSEEGEVALPLTVKPLQEYGVAVCKTATMDAGRVVRRADGRSVRTESLAEPRP